MTIKDVFSSFQCHSWSKLRIFLLLRIQKDHGYMYLICVVVFFLTFELITRIAKHSGYMDAK